MLADITIIMLQPDVEAKVGLILANPRVTLKCTVRVGGGAEELREWSVK